MESHILDVTIILRFLQVDEYVKCYAQKSKPVLLEFKTQMRCHKSQRTNYVQELLNACRKRIPIVLNCETFFDERYFHLIDRTFFKNENISEIDYDLKIVEPGIEVNKTQRVTMLLYLLIYKALYHAQTK